MIPYDETALGAALEGTRCAQARPKLEVAREVRCPRLRGSRRTETFRDRPSGLGLARTSSAAAGDGWRSAVALSVFRLGCGRTRGADRVALWPGRSHWPPDTCRYR